jgi:hypothetical protein
MRVDCWPDPVFGAAAAAIRLWPDALMIDVGQTQVKVVTSTRRVTRLRDLALLPIRDDDTDDRSAGGDVGRGSSSQRAAFVDMVAGAIHAAAEPGRPPWRRVVLAMPCSVDVDASGGLEFGGSSYIAMAGDHRRMNDLASLIPHATWSVLNDAELAVYAARASATTPVASPVAPSTATAERQLVVTFGFGLGGCVWDPSRVASSEVASSEVAS